MDNEKENLFGLLGKEWYKIMFRDNIIEVSKWKESHPTHAVEDCSEIGLEIASMNHKVI